MAEGDVTIDEVWRFVQRVPGFADDLGIRSRSQLSFLGAGGNAEVVYLGDRRVLKVTRSSAQGAMSRLAMESRPPSVVTVFSVVEAAASEPRGLPSLPKKGEEPSYESRAWGIVEELTVPVETLPQMLDLEIAGVPAQELLDRYDAVVGSAFSRRPPDDPEVERWRSAYEEAIDWVTWACDKLDVPPDLDTHPGNWGVHPETGDLLLIDLGQCYELS